MAFAEDRALKGKGCVDNGVLSVELQQRYIYHASDPDYAGEFNNTDSFFRVKVHSTTSNGRYLNQVVFTDEIWLGGLPELFNSGPGRYKRPVKLPEVRLPELPAGVYRVSFEVPMRLNAELLYDRAKLPDGVVSIGPVYIKVKV